MTYEKTVKLCLLAEARLKKLISAMTMAKQLRGPVATPKKKEKEVPDTDAGNKEKKKEERRKDPKKETNTGKQTWLPLPEKFKNLTTEQRNALSRKCQELNVCKNCADHDKSWPTHKSWQCPFENRWGGKWPDRHETVNIAFIDNDSTHMIQCALW